MAACVNEETGMEGGHHPARWPTNSEQACRSRLILVGNQPRAQNDVGVMKACQSHDEGMKKHRLRLVDHRRRTLDQCQPRGKGGKLLAKRGA